MRITDLVIYFPSSWAVYTSGRDELKFFFREISYLNFYSFQIGESK